MLCSAFYETCHAINGVKRDFACFPFIFPKLANKLWD